MTTDEGSSYARASMIGRLLNSGQECLGTARVYYDVQEEPEQVVTVLAVGIKVGNRLLIGGEEVEL